MAKKVLSIVLAVLFVFSSFAIVGSAVDDVIYPDEEMAITNPKERIDIVFLSGKIGSTNLRETPADEEILEYNLSFWSQEIIDEYHALKAKGASDAEWEALYEKMKTPWNDDYEYWGDYRYKYYATDPENDIDDKNAVAKVWYVPSKTEVEPGETFTVDMVCTTNFYFSIIYATIFYDKTNIDIIENMDADKGDVGFTFGPEFETWRLIGGKPYFDWGMSPRDGDVRPLNWPKDLRNEAAYNQYAGCRVSSFADNSKKDQPNFVKAIKADNTVIGTFTFKVKEDAQPGYSIKFFTPTDIQLSFEKEDLYTQNKKIDYGWQFERANGPQDDSLPDYHAARSKTMIVSDSYVNVKSDTPVVEYADYTALDAAVNEFDSRLSAFYTKSSWAAYASAVTAGSTLSRTILKSEQATVDAATKAITDAKAALVSTSVISAETVGTPTIGSEANVKVVVSGSPEATRLVDANDPEVSTTFERGNVMITEDGDNEIWTFKVLASEANSTYNVFARYSKEWLGDYKVLTVNAVDGLDLSIHSISIPDMYPAGTYMDGKIKKGVHQVIIKTSTDVCKIQFVAPDGSTRTYDNKNYPPVVLDSGECVWTINYNFDYLGALNLDLRTRAVTTTFALTGDSITGRVMY